MKQVEEVQLLHLGRPVDGRSYSEVCHPLLQELELGRLPVREESAVEVVLDVDTSLGSIPHRISEPGRGPAPRGLLVGHDGHGELILVVRRDQRGKDAEGEGDCRSDQ